MDSAVYISYLTCLLITNTSVLCENIPVIEKVFAVARDGNVLALQLEGVNFKSDTDVKTSASAERCDGPGVVVQGSVFFPTSVVGYLQVTQAENTTFYFCVRQTGVGYNQWIHQGPKVVILGDSGINNEIKDHDLALEEKSHAPVPTNSSPIENSSRSSPRGADLGQNAVGGVAAALFRRIRSTHQHQQQRRQAEDTKDAVSLFGMRVESSDSKWDDDGVVMLLAHSTVRIRLFGENFSPRTVLTLTSARDGGDGACEFPSSEIFKLMDGTLRNHSAVVEVAVPGPSTHGGVYYLCLKDGNGTNGSGRQWRHQGEVPWLQFRVYDKLLPVWATAVIIIMLLCFSALFSGLTLGLMSLDKTDLKILCNTGKELERKYAAAIMPVRSHGSLLLCSLLLGNVLVNSVLTILMDDLTSGVVAVIFSTLTIVIFGEIMPQAVCARHGLAVGAKTIYITKFVIAVTAIVAWPISKILDYMLGEEIGNVYNRERLNELVKTGTDIEKDEANIITGALQLSKKIVTSVMTKLEDVYMLSYDTILDFETVSEIMNSGYSRIPVYDGKRSNIVTLLYIKDLAFVDPDDSTPLKTLCEFYQNLCYFVFEDMTLDILFKKFKEGTFGHMAFVQRVNSEGEGDPFYETLGLLTLEDVIEEIIQAEIVDETDVWTDNRSKRKREKIAKCKDFAAFAEKRERQRIHISPHLTLATFQYLSTTVAPFKSPLISAPILQRMLQQDVYRHIKAKNKDREAVYQQNRASDYFVLILEGRVEVLVGKENLRFESGPFTYFGVQALLPCSSPVAGESPTSIVPISATGSLQSVNAEPLRHPFVPDYTVRATTELFYVLIKRSLYVAALRATRLELSKKAGDHFDDEVDKLLHIDDDDRSQPGSQSSRRGSHCEKESPLGGGDPWPGGECLNGLLPNVKLPSDLSDAEERTTLLEPAVS